jgi:hypothetical protein
VSGVFTKVVYVRFIGPSIDGSQSYTDDVILDTGKPNLYSATVTSAGSSVASNAVTSASVARLRTFSVKSKAKDKRSGVAKLQLNTKKRAAGAATVDYLAKRKVQMSFGTSKKPRAVYVRVQDGAGNWSKWKRIRVRG